MKFIYLFLISCCCAVAGAQTSGITTEHGYRFFHHINTGGPKAQRGETIKAYVNIYAGDSLLSSSRKNLGGTYKYDIPAPEAELQHFPPIMDASLLMAVGDSATIYQPVDDNMRSYLPKGAENTKELRFEIAMAQIITSADKAKADQAFAQRAARLKTDVENKIREYNAGLLNDKIRTLPSGLKLLVQEKGSGPVVVKGRPVQLHYYGYLPNGTMFDNSFEKRHPLAFPAGVGQVNAGLDEGVQLLNRGARAYLFIPNKLAYGNEEDAGGKIPAGSDLVFYVEIL